MGSHDKPPHFHLAGLFLKTNSKYLRPRVCSAFNDHDHPVQWPNDQFSYRISRAYADDDGETSYQPFQLIVVVHDKHFSQYLYDPKIRNHWGGIG